ncbi:Uncharacterized protein PBTT_09090 [Plasmodiophora brassicae]
MNDVEWALLWTGIGVGTSLIVSLTILFLQSGRNDRQHRELVTILQRMEAHIQGMEAHIQGMEARIIEAVRDLRCS